MADWAEKDITSTVQWMRERYRDLPLVYVGHSFGGQALGLLKNNTEVSRALFIAAQAGYWKLMASPERYRVYALLNFVGVPLTKMFGYMPGWAGLGEDMPKDAFLQWVGWVMKERYLFGDSSLDTRENFHNYKNPLRAICFTDDPWATRTAVELLCSGFTATKPDIVSISPTRYRREENRPYGLLPARASRHAVAGCGGMAAGGIAPRRNAPATVLYAKTLRISFRAPEQKSAVQHRIPCTPIQHSLKQRGASHTMCAQFMIALPRRTADRCGR